MGLWWPLLRAGVHHCLQFIYLLSIHSRGPRFSLSTFSSRLETPLFYCYFVLCVVCFIHSLLIDISSLTIIIMMMMMMMMTMIMMMIIIIIIIIT